MVQELWAGVAIAFQVALNSNNSSSGSKRFKNHIPRAVPRPSSTGWIFMPKSILRYCPSALGSVTTAVILFNSRSVCDSGALAILDGAVCVRRQEGEEG